MNTQNLSWDAVIINNNIIAQQEFGITIKLNTWVVQYQHLETSFLVKHQYILFVETNTVDVFYKELIFKERKKAFNEDVKWNTLKSTYV